MSPAARISELKRKAIFLLYRVLQTLGSPAILLYLLLRVVRNPRYLPTLRERFGELPALWQRTVPGAIWLHAVSVGEVLAALPLIEELARRAPRASIFLSTSTLAGHQTARIRLQGRISGVFYAPLDFAWVIRRVLRHLEPSVVVVMETEIWPNLFREARRIGCGLLIVNGRISDRALPRYRRFAWLFREVLPLCQTVAVQSDEMAERFVEVGAAADCVRVTGNLKYDLTPPPARTIGFIEASRAPLWIAASTSVDEQVEEEDAVIEAQRRLPGWRLMIAPRKPERFEAVARKLTASGLRWTRRTALADPDADVLLLDSIGELSGLFAHASVVFMGGTLAAKGGHNILEPALFGKPVIAGPHLENFRDIEQHFEKYRAVMRIEAAGELAGAVLRAAADSGLGERARAAAELQRGAAARTADAVMSIYKTNYPSDRPHQPWFAFLWLFAQLWKAGSAWDRRHKRGAARRLPVPVVSVGNITAGGTGKTPVTIELLRDFRASHPALLTRGHGRHTRDLVLLPRGDEKLPIELTGDEAQLYMRGACAPMAIAPDRFEAGTHLLGTSPEIGVFFLDDGFQHLQLERDFDLVLVDSTHPFGGGALLPLGRLREPLEGLARADAFLITREDEAPNVEAIEAELRRFNPKAPIFRARVELRRWTNLRGETFSPEALKGLRSVAFCGLGNPGTFWRSLDQLGVDTLERIDYGDHHRYSPLEVRRLARHAEDIGVEALVTTAKDAVNLCPEFGRIVEPLRLYWLEIGVRIENRAELIGLIERRIGASGVSVPPDSTHPPPAKTPRA
jgi:tetraacyldisaccharide 4'-kinase